MNKKIVISLTFMSIFILLGVGYQPIIAEESIIDKVLENKVSNNRITELNNLYSQSFKLILNLNNDCNCSNDFDFKFIICVIIYNMAAIIYNFYFYSIGSPLILYPFVIIWVFTFIFIYDILDCDIFPNFLVL